MAEVIDILKEASARIRDSVEGMAGTERAAGDFGRGAGGDISRNIDVTAERAVLKYLEESGFSCVVLGEECGRVEICGGDGGHLIMDAIDGSANAVRGVPFYCSSLAYAEGGRLSNITDGVVTDLAMGGTYAASRGKGATLDGRPISVHGPDPIYRMVGLNTSGATPETVAKLQNMFGGGNHTRHMGANALEMALLACGQLDVMVDLRKKIRVQDIAAGYILVKEAGGVVLDEDMGPLDAGLGYETRVSFVAASSTGMARQVMEGAG